MICSGCGKAHRMADPRQGGSRAYRLTEKGFKATDPYWFAKRWNNGNGVVRTERSSQGVELTGTSQKEA